MKPSFELIGLAGKAGSGKDHLAQHYFEKLGYKKLSLGWMLKWVMVAQDRCSWEDVFVHKDPTTRALMQALGTEVWRATYGQDVWVRALDAVANTLAAEWGQTKFVVADVRFRNELAAVQQLGRCFKVEAPIRAANSKLSLEQRQHPSETDLDSTPLSQFDGVLYNDPHHAHLVGEQVERLIRLV